MCSMVVVVVFEIIEFSCQVERIPERGLIKAFTSDGANNPFDERVGHCRARQRCRFRRTLTPVHTLEKISR